MRVQPHTTESLDVGTHVEGSRKVVMRQPREGYCVAMICAEAGPMDGV